MTEKDKQKAPRRAPKKVERPKAPEKNEDKSVVTKIRKKVEDKLAKDVPKASVGDYIKLIALEKELEQATGPSELKVIWVEDSEK